MLLHNQIIKKQVETTTAVAKIINLAVKIKITIIVTRINKVIAVLRLRIMLKANSQLAIINNFHGRLPLQRQRMYL